ncbi:TPA: hypothetical protein N2D10_003273 [Clostridium botulinum]|nr:hypothetical protein [Clostridium botulinum]
MKNNKITLEGYKNEKHEVDFKTLEFIAINNYNKTLDEFLESYTHEDVNYIINNLITYELCPECEYEVTLLNRMKKQVCPICGKEIIPCSICDIKECSKCNL